MALHWLCLSRDEMHFRSRNFFHNLGSFIIQIHECPFVRFGPTMLLFCRLRAAISNIIKTVPYNLVPDQAQFLVLPNYVGERYLKVVRLQASFPLICSSKPFMYVAMASVSRCVAISRAITSCTNSHSRESV